MAEATKQVSATGRPKPPNAGKGRPKGSRNKTTKAVKEMVIAALEEAGGIDYLLVQARDNPTAFMTLVGKVLPLQADVNHGGKVVAEVVFKGLNA